MTLVWSGWEDDPSAGAGLSPYIDWLKTVTFGGQEDKDGISIAPLPLSRLACGMEPGGPLCGDRESPAPLPGFARRPDGAEMVSGVSTAARGSWLPGCRAATGAMARPCRSGASCSGPGSTG